MSRFVRASKYRHVFGQPAKRENALENLKVTSNAWDTNLVDASGLYLSLNWNASGGGAFAILPLPSPFRSLPNNLPSKLPDVIPLARGHTAAVLDTSWSPFNDSVVASAGEDGKVLIWKVEASAFDGWGAEGWEPRDFDPVARISASPRKIGQVLFHPTASNVLAAASGEHTVKLWDLNNTDDHRSILTGHTDTIQSICFNRTGTILVTTCRDKKIRMFDPRAGGEAVRVTEGHSGLKGSRLAWMGDLERIACTGFSKMSDRQIGIWETGSLANITTTTIDQSSGVVMPFWSDNNILFLAGKGDGNIRYYEYESDSLFALAEHKSNDPQRGMCFLPRRALSVSDCEIARAYKVASAAIEPIAFIVPRKADSFQSDIFPPAPSLEPALEASEFFAGKTAAPKVVDLQTGAVSAASTPIASPSSQVPPPTKSFSAPIPEPAPTPVAAPVRKTTEPTPSFSAKVEPPVEEPKTPFSPSSQPPQSAGGAANQGDAALREENARLNAELREARAQIRNLELQVETMKANAQRAAKALMESQM